MNYLALMLALILVCLFWRRAGNQRRASLRVMQALEHDEWREICVRERAKS